MKKRSYKILSVILSLFILFSIFPISSYAKTTSFEQFEIGAYGNKVSAEPNNTVNFPYNLSNSNLQSEFTDYYVDAFPLLKVSDGDYVTLTLVTTQGLASRYKSWKSAEFIVYLYEDLGLKEISVNRYNANYDATTSTFTCSFTVSSAGYIYVIFNGSNPTVVNADTVHFYWVLTSFTADIESAETGFFNSVKNFFSQLFQNLSNFFNSLFEWLREIRDNAVKLGQDIKSWFSDLTNSIKSFFTDLGNNLKEWFSNIGDWFSQLSSNIKQWFIDIGDKIGSFFTNLWNNITDTVDNIRQSIRDWWQSVVDFFHSLFVPEDGYFDKYKQDWEDWARAHFTLFYDVSDIFDSLSESFSNKAGLAESFYIPEIRLPFFDNPVILPEIRFSFREFVNQHEMISTVFDIFQVMVSCIGFFFIVKYCMNTFSKIITGDEDTL